MSTAADQSNGQPQRSVLSAPPSRLTAEPGGVLSLGRDTRLLASRAGVLRVAGRPVRSATPEQVPLLAANTHFDLVVFGHTLSDEETATLAGCFRRAAPQTKLLMTYFDPRPDAVEALFDGCVRSTDGPAALVQAVRMLLRTEGAASRD